MLKIFLTICFSVMVFGGSSIRGWSEDIEDHFLDPDFDTSKTVFIDVKDASLINVLKIISKQTDLSFIADHEVADKKITLYLNKVPLNQALQTVLDANGLMYEMQGDTNVFVIKAKYKTEKTRITKVYQLKYATVSSSKLNSTISSSDSGSGGSGGKAASGVSSGGLEEAIKDSLSPDGKVIEDSRTNSLIITDVPGQFEIIESTIVKLDVPIPQVLIEVEMLEVDKSTADQLGITYGSSTGFSPVIFTGASKAVNYPFSASPASASNTGSGTTSSTTSSSNSSSNTGPYTPGSFSATGMTAALQFLSTRTNARTLARPRILTLNNETAQIEISTDQALSVENSTTSSTASGTAVTGNTVERYTTGVILKVTPQANLLTHEITMAVSPKVVDATVSSISNTIYDPTTRGSDSILKLKDGQSMVIGGLLNTTDSKSVSKLPFLGDLPLIGAAFRSTNKTKIEKELIIFLTPHIVDENDRSYLKPDASSISAQAALDIQDASDRAEKIDDSLNNYETKN